MLTNSSNETAQAGPTTQAARTKRGARLSTFSIRHDSLTGKHDLAAAIKVIERLAALGAMIADGDHAEQV